MAFNRDKHHRRSVRLKGYDYTAPGAYFITICTYQRQCLFGKIVDDQMHLNDFGQIASECWNDIPNHFRQTTLDAHVIMPNHIHGILIITDKSRRGMALPCPDAPSCPDNQSNSCDTAMEIPRDNDQLRQSRRGMALPCPYTPLSGVQQFNDRQFGQPIAQSISTIVGSFKSVVTKRINLLRNAKGTPVWQRNYYDHVIRDDASMHYIRSYIQNNPRSWLSDQLYPDISSKW
jgi:REP element-mobilizing transposase RayT